MKRFISIILSIVMIFSLCTPAFAVNNQKDNEAISLAMTTYNSLTPEQQNIFITQIELLALNGDTRLVEFHHQYVDPNYSFDPSSSSPIATRAAAVDVTGALQALNYK